DFLVEVEDPPHLLLVLREGLHEILPQVVMPDDVLFPLNEAADVPPVGLRLDPRPEELQELRYALAFVQFKEALDTQAELDSTPPEGRHQAARNLVLLQHKHLP